MIHVQLPNVNQAAWQRVLQSGAFYNLLGFLSGGALQKLSIIAMGITPYINASIIMQLMTVVLPQLEEMAKKGGEEGRKKISQYTRWLTIVLGTIQATFMAISMERSGVFYDTSTWYLLYAIIAMVGGTLFLMWLGEQITDKGIGNGVSLIIFIGIVLRYPQYVSQTYASASQGAESLLNLFSISPSRSSSSSRSSFSTRDSGASRCSKHAASSAARCLPAARPTFRCASTTPASSRSSSRSRFCCCPSRRSRGSAERRTGDLGASLRALRVPDQRRGYRQRLQRLVLAQRLPLQHRLLRPGRGLHVLLQLDRAQHARRRRQPQEDRRLHSGNSPGPADGGLSQQDPDPHHDRGGNLSRPARRACRARSSVVSRLPPSISVRHRCSSWSASPSIRSRRSRRV